MPDCHANSMPGSTFVDSSMAFELSRTAAAGMLFAVNSEFYWFAVGQLMGWSEIDVVAHHPFNFDGMEYEIIVRTRGDGFHATWSCKDCALSGPAISRAHACGGGDCRLFVDCRAGR